jgi:hypothetical protein
MSYPAPYKTMPTTTSNCSWGGSLPTQGPTMMTTSPRLHCFSLWIGRGHEPQPLIFNYSGLGGGTNAPTLSFLMLRTGWGHNCPHPLVFENAWPGGGMIRCNLAVLMTQEWEGAQLPPHPHVLTIAGPSGDNNGPLHLKYILFK